jgi:hypothetical protein
MKAIIFTGIALFGAAAIYGITDFAAEKKNGRMDQLYKEETAAPPVTEEKETAAVPAAGVVPTAAPAATTTGTTKVAKKSSVKKKTKKARREEVRFIRIEDFSRGRIKPREIKADEPASTAAEVKEEN